MAMAAQVEDLLVYQKALAAAGELFALIERTGLRRDVDLAAQMNRASASVAANISEGFEQKTDRHFAQYLYTARGGAREVRTHLQVGVGRRHLSEHDAAALSERYEEVGKMLTGLIDYLKRSDWKERTR